MKYAKALSYYIQVKMYPSVMERQRWNLHFYCINISYLKDNMLTPVSMTCPAKRQKRTPCVRTRWTCLSVHSPSVAHCTPFLSRQHDVIASFLLCTCAFRSFSKEVNIFVKYSARTFYFEKKVITHISCLFMTEKQPL